MADGRSWGYDPFVATGEGEGDRQTRGITGISGTRRGGLGFHAGCKQGAESWGGHGSRGGVYLIDCLDGSADWVSS